MSLISGYNIRPESMKTTEDEILTYHRIAEAMKFAYAKRSLLGDAAKIDVAEVLFSSN